MRTPRKVLALVASVAVAGSVLWSGLAGASLRPVIVAAYPSTTIPNGGTVHLCAKTGTISVPGHASVPVWGYALSGTGTDCGSLTAQVPGPTLEIDQGSTVTVTLHNDLAEPSSLSFPGFAGVPDLTGASGGGGTASYTLTASRPGTFLYESGRNAARQVAMGMYGAIVVRPTTAGTAYGTPASSFDREYLFVLSEIDLDQHAAPGSFAMVDYHPTIHLIGGTPYDPGNPGASDLVVGGGEQVLIRYVNAGLDHHTMTLLNARQSVVARDGYPLTAYSVADETIPAGMTTDVIVEIPGSAGSGARFPIYERNLHVTNDADYPGGMLRFLVVP